MTTDPFTEAARKRAEQIVPLDGGEPNLIFRDRRELVEMAEWARTHLAAQEPTQDEVLDLIEDRLDDAGVAGIAETSDGEIVTTVDATMDEVLTAARAALSAAGAVRGREQALAQEPTDAEVEAARQATDDHLIVTEHYRGGEIRWQGCKTCDVEIRDYAEQDRHELRAALSAARAARRDEETR